MKCPLIYSLPLLRCFLLVSQCYVSIIKRVNTQKIIYKTGSNAPSHFSVTLKAASLARMSDKAFVSSCKAPSLDFTSDGSPTQLTHPWQYGRHSSGPERSASQNHESSPVSATLLLPRLHTGAFRQMLPLRCVKHLPGRL